MPSAEAARIFLWLAQYPWREVTWLGPGHSIPWYHEPATFPLGGGNEAVLLLDDPGRLPGPGGAAAGRILVRRRAGPLAVDRPDQRAGAGWPGAGSASLVTQLAAQRRSWVYEPRNAEP